MDLRPSEGGRPTIGSRSNPFFTASACKCMRLSDRWDGAAGLGQRPLPATTRNTFSCVFQALTRTSPPCATGNGVAFTLEMLCCCRSRQPSLSPFNLTCRGEPRGYE
eukprot:scaffold305_cov247-Pinguiococcus_pyrenoidosus.AAC.34